MTIGAFSSPDFTISLNARPARWRSPRPIQQMRAGRPWKAMRSPRHVEPAVQVRVVREELLHLRVGLADVVRIARQRDPAERPLAAAEQRPDVRRHEAREVERVRRRPRRTRPGGCCCRSRRSARPASGSRASPARASRSSSPRRRAARACCAGSACAACHCATRPAGGQVAVDEVVRRGLVGDEVGRGCRRPARAAAARAASSAALPSRPTETARFASACGAAMRASASSRSFACSSR